MDGLRHLFKNWLTLGAVLLLSVVCLSAKDGLCVKAEALDDIPSELTSDQVTDDQLDYYVKKGIIPKTEWNAEQWKIYKRAVSKNLPGGYFAFYIEWDGETMTDKKIVFIPNDTGDWNQYGTNTTLEDADSPCIRLTESADYPRCYPMDAAQCAKGGEFRIYEKDEQKPNKYIKDLELRSNNDMTAGAVITKHVWSVTFVRDDSEDAVDVKHLPHTMYFFDGKELRTESVPEWSDSYSALPNYFNDRGYMFFGGYAFSHWEDAEGTPYYENENTVQKKLVLHPKLKNWQEAYKYKDVVEAKTANEFLKEVEVGRGHIVVVKTDITIDKKQLAAYKEEVYSGQSSNNEKFYWRNGFVIVEDGATLTFDGVEAEVNYGSNSGNDESQIYLTVEKGGSLLVQNGARFDDCNGADDGFSFSIQKGANMTIRNASCALMCLYNHGTVLVDSFEGEAATKYYASQPLTVRGNLFNAEGAKITVNYGSFRIDNEKYANEYHIDDVYRPFVNRGTIEIKQHAGMELYGESSTHQDDRSLLRPFLNEGNITVTAVRSEDNAAPSVVPFEIKYSKLWNTGEINILQPEYTVNRVLDSVANNGSYTGFYIYESIVTNEGKMTFKATDGLAAYISTQGLFFDPEKDNYGNTYGKEAEYTNLTNLENGVIELESDDDSIALSIDADCKFNNYGTVTVKDTAPASRMDRVTLTNEGMINNQGSIINNGTIGYHYYSSQELPLYEGTPYEGEGRESYKYTIAAEDSRGYSVPDKTKITATANGEALEIQEGYSYYGYLPGAAALSIVMQAEGYPGGSGTFRTAATLSEYMGVGVKDRVSTFYVNVGTSANSGDDPGEDDPGEDDPGEENPGGGSSSGGGNSAGGGNGSSSGTSGGGNGGSSGGGSSTGNPTPQPTETKTEPAENKQPIESSDGNQVTTTAKGEATVTQVKKTGAKSVTVKPTTKVDGVEYTVTTVDAGAFQNASKATTVTLPYTITKIKANAFAKSKVKTVRITIKKGAALAVDKKAFKGSNVKTVQVTMSKKATKKEKNKVIKAFKKAGIKAGNIKMKFKG